MNDKLGKENHYLYQQYVSTVQYQLQNCCYSVHSIFWIMFVFRTTARR